MNKQALKEELVDLRMKLAEAENQALKIIDQFSLESNAYSWELAQRTKIDIQQADDKLCRIARKMGLDKLDLVKPKELNNAK